MSAEAWDAADSPLALLHLLEQCGEQRRLRLLACALFRRLRERVRHVLLIGDRIDEPTHGWPAVLDLAERFADAPASAADQETMRRVRTELAIDCQALGRLMVQRTAGPPPAPVAMPPPVHILARLLLVAAVSRFFGPPSLLAEAPLDPALFGDGLDLETATLPEDHPRAFAERRLAARLTPIADPFASVLALLEGMTAAVAPLFLAGDGTTGPEPNLHTFMGELRVQSPDEMQPIVQAVRDIGQEDLHALMSRWMEEVTDPARQPHGSVGLLQTSGLTFTLAALVALESDNPSLATFHAALAETTRLVRGLAGNPFRPAGIDPWWVQRDDWRVGRLAEGIYQDQRWDDLPILGDALEEAGCPDRAVLDALRHEPVPYRGWWLLDALRLPPEDEP